MSFRIAVQNIRSNFLHTILSTLGIVIGVAALVAILSFIDGLEEYARDQITKTTSIKSVVVNTNTRERVDGVRLQKKKYQVILPENLKDLKQRLGENALVQLQISDAAKIHLDSSEDTTATYFTAMLPDTIPISDDQILKGHRTFQNESLNGGYTAIISYSLAQKLQPQHIDQLTGKTVAMNGEHYQITGILKKQVRNNNWILVPITSFSKKYLKTRAPQLLVQAPKIEEIDLYKTKIHKWLDKNFESADSNFQLITNKARVDQANKGILLFKIVMGLITGISVIVGGIGIMNVLLISVTERTTEIGIRKATGAKKADIILQFLSESVTVSVFGSLLGLIVGAGVALISVPIIKYFIDAPFQVSFTFETIILISVLAIVIGIVFGTYPAVKAARLTPVEAIRHE
ncbi:MAG TPA: ABC transporter permease [Balneolaceae bacterium]|nr:ABC transporter permease [Balneolaceae bacterium]